VLFVSGRSSRGADGVVGWSQDTRAPRSELVPDDQRDVWSLTETAGNRWGTEFACRCV
jgi:hypothetical protein